MKKSTKIVNTWGRGRAELLKQGGLVAAFIEAGEEIQEAIEECAREISNSFDHLALELDLERRRGDSVKVRMEGPHATDVLHQLRDPLLDDDCGRILAGNLRDALAGYPRSAMVPDEKPPTKSETESLQRWLTGGDRALARRVRDAAKVRSGFFPRAEAKAKAKAKKARRGKR